MCEIELDEKTEISCECDDNQNKQNYSETVSSQLHATFLSDSKTNDKVRSPNLKQRQICEFIYNWVSYMSKLSQGRLQSNQQHFICFSETVEAVGNDI